MSWLSLSLVDNSRLTPRHLTDASPAHHPALLTGPARRPSSPVQLTDRSEHPGQPPGDADVRGRPEPGPRRIVDLAERSVAGRGPGHQDRGPGIVPVKGVDD